MSNDVYPREETIALPSQRYTTFPRQVVYILLAEGFLLGYIALVAPIVFFKAAIWIMAPEWPPEIRSAVEHAPELSYLVVVTASALHLLVSTALRFRPAPPEMLDEAKQIAKKIPQLHSSLTATERSPRGVRVQDVLYARHLEWLHDRPTPPKG